MALQSYVCKHCGDEFEAHEGTQTAELGFCSRACLSAKREQTAPGQSN